MNTPFVREFRNIQPLTPAVRQSWLDALKVRLCARAQEKFEDGAAEHKCDLGEQSVAYLLQQMEDEALDQFIYVSELRRRLVERPM